MLNTLKKYHKKYHKKIPQNKHKITRKYCLKFYKILWIKYLIFIKQSSAISKRISNIFHWQREKILKKYVEQLKILADLES